MPTAGRLLVVAPLMAGLAWGSITAFDAARADLLVREAGTEIRAWADMHVTPQQETWNSVRASLIDAGRLHPGSPAPHELLGHIGMMRTGRPELISEAIDEFIQALRRRPGSPFTWAGLAEARYRLGEQGRNLELALNLASTLGPAEPGVQRVVADYGLAVWNEVTPGTQAAIERTLAAGIRRNPLELLQISERRGRLDIACRHLADSSRKAGPQVNRLCPSWELTP